MANHPPRPVMEWQSTIAMMRVHGTRVIRTCSACKFHEDVDLDEMERVLGSETCTLWDARPMCDLCDQLSHFMCSPGAGTPFRPMLSRPPDSEREPLPPEAWMAGWCGRFRY